MIFRLHTILIAGSLLLLIGCSTRPAGPVAPFSATTQPQVTKPSVDQRSELMLEQIRPELQLPAAPPRSTTRPTLDQLTLYARARLAMHRNQTFTAITLLERLVREDPEALDPLLDLARAYSVAPGLGPRAIEMLERAAALEPDQMLVHLELARLHTLRRQPEKALEALLLAVQTTDYRQNHPESAIVDYRLAVLLEEQGYLRAALEQYRRLQRRLEYPTYSMRRLHDLQDLLERPYLIDLAIARLHEKLQEPELALEAYQRVLPHQSANLELHQAIINTLLATGRQRQAMVWALQTVRLFNASSSSIELLKRTYERAGRSTTIATDLARMHRRSPADRAILLALVDVHLEQNRPEQALSVLERAWERQADDVLLADRYIALLHQQGRSEQAMRVLIRLVADSPDALESLGSSVQALFDPLTGVRPTWIERLSVPPSQVSVQLYLAGRVAQQQGRRAQAQSMLERAVQVRPLFAPAVRSLWAMLDDPDRRLQWLGELEEALDPVLRTELQADHLIRTGDFRSAREQLEPFIAQPQPPRQLRWLHALALQQEGRLDDFEQAIQNALDSDPTWAEGYLLLINHYRQTDRPVQTVQLIRRWMESDPSSVAARVQQIVELIRLGHTVDAQRILEALFRESPTDPTVLGTLVGYYSRTQNLPRALELIAQAWRSHPTSRLLIGALVEVHTQLDQESQALQVVDEARMQAGDDPDGLYFLAHLYHRLQRPLISRQVLEQVLKLQPDHALASNDLGYALAEAGERLEEAERLTRFAVKVDPDNPSFLDSLGWVLYKRGDFQQAVVWLERAVEASDDPDPIILDHLGDALWRLGRHEQAVEQWREARNRLEAMESTSRPDLVELRRQLDRKLQAVEIGREVGVATVGEQ